MSVSTACDLIQWLGLALCIGVFLALTSLRVVYNFVTFSFRRFSNRTEQDIHAIYDGWRGMFPAGALVLPLASHMKTGAFIGLLCVAFSIGYLIGSWKSPRRLY